MSWEAWFTLGVIGLCFCSLLFSKIATDIIIVGGALILLTVGILTPQEALAGMSNEGMATVALLFIVAAGLKETGAITLSTQWLLGRPRNLPQAQSRMMLPVMGMSALLNNTPVVAMMIPAVSDWAKRQQISVSKLMMPLSYAAIAGGTLTLIGTSTNLVINGLLINETGSGFGLWDIAWVGLPAVIVVLLYVLITSPWLLKERVPAVSQFKNMREYTVEMVVDPLGPLVGKSIEEAGLRQLPGLFLTSIERNGETLAAVSPQIHLEANDHLLFAGVTESILDLQKIRGLMADSGKDRWQRHNHALVEVVVSNDCPLVGKSIREGRFRSYYNAAVIAVARNGQRLHQKIGDIVLKPGDTLLLEARPGFSVQQKNARDFYMVSQLKESAAPRHDKAGIALLIMVGMVGSVTLGLLSMFKAAFLAAGLMVATRCISASNARRSIDWQILIVIAAAIALGTAITKTGAASSIAQQLIELAGANPMLALVFIYLMTVVCTELITNNAAAVLMFPIAFLTAQQLGVDVTPFIVCIMFAASCSFSTPIGYQTNLMVYGPGGYRFSDFLRFGLPLTVLLGIMAVSVIPAVWSF